MTTYILNLLDLAFTLYALNHGGVELNPLMTCVPFQVFYKVFVVGALIWWLSRSKLPIARIGLKLSAIAFAIVNLWHIVNIAAQWAV